VAPMISGMTKHFMFHIRWISIFKFLYFKFFSDSFCITFQYDGIDTSISKQILFIIIIFIYICRLNDTTSATVVIQRGNRNDWMTVNSNMIT
jgi:hypothetical protein